MADPKISSLKKDGGNSVVIGLQRITLETSGTPLTKMQQECYCFLHSVIGKALRVEEVEDMLQLRSPLAWWSRLDHLEEKGWIVRQDLLL